MLVHDTYVAVSMNSTMYYVDLVRGLVSGFNSKLRLTLVGSSIMSQFNDVKPIKRQLHSPKRWRKTTYDD